MIKTTWRFSLMLMTGLYLTACGGGGESNSAPSNRPPVAQDVVVDTNEAESVSGQLSATDADGDALSYQLVSTSSTSHKGTLELTNTSTGAFNYTPDPSEFGVDVFTFRVNDGRSNSNDATLTVRINARPRVADMTVQTVADELVVNSVAVTDEDMGILSAAIDTLPTNGTAIITNSASGDFEYQPNPGYVGPDSFTVIATDGSAQSIPGTVSIDVSQRPVINFTSNSSIGNESQTEKIEVSLDVASPLDSRVDVFINSNAAVGLDFDQPASSVDILAGDTTAEIELNVLADSEIELGEFIDLTLTAPCLACDIGSDVVTHTVRLDDWRGTIQLTTGNNASGMVIEAVADDATSGPIVGGFGGGTYLGNTFSSPDAFLAKFDRAGELVWFTPVLPLLPAGRADARVRNIIVAPDGSVIAVGRTGIIGESASVFLIKLSSSGAAQWSTVYGGTEEDIATRIALDSIGNIYVAGRTSNDLGGPSAGSCDLFVAKFDPAGAFQWVRQIGSPICDVGVGLAVTTAGNIVVAGTMYGSVAGMPIAGSTAVLILSFDQAGNELWRTYLDSPQNELVGEAVALPSGGIIIVGNADELQFGRTGVYLAKVSDGGIIEWISQGTDPSSTISDAAITANGEIVITLFASDIRVLAYDTTGVFLWGQQFGGPAQDTATGIGVDENSNAFVGAWSNGNLLGFVRPSGRHSVLVKLDETGLIH